MVFENYFKADNNVFPVNDSFMYNNYSSVFILKKQNNKKF